MSFINRIEFVKKVRENGDIYTFFFKKPKRLKHKAGQHGILIQSSLTRPHPFSLSSAPEEEYITISTHVRRESRYKQHLANMQPGQKMTLLGPTSNFTFADDAKMHVFLAQGIGITPFRSMLVHAHEQPLPIDIALVHVQDTPHTFRNITEKYASQALYPTTSEEIRELAAKQDKSSTYYLSGSPKFVANTKTFLREQGVDASRIRTDSFLGY